MSDKEDYPGPALTASTNTQPFNSADAVSHIEDEKAQQHLEDDRSLPTPPQSLVETSSADALPHDKDEEASQHTGQHGPMSCSLAQAAVRGSNAGHSTVDRLPSQPTSALTLHSHRRRISISPPISSENSSRAYMIPRPEDLNQPGPFVTLHRPISFSTLTSSGTSTRDYTLPRLADLNLPIPFASISDFALDQMMNITFDASIRVAGLSEDGATRMWILWMSYVWNVAEQSLAVYMKTDKNYSDGQFTLPLYDFSNQVQFHESAGKPCCTYVR
ncbi:MAG: hypothetical protein Q9177_000610 [Variospora cf. flavescens]